MENTIVTRLGNNGRLVIPREIRKQLQLKDGDPVQIGIENGRIVIVTAQALLETFYSSTQNIRESTTDPVQDLIDEHRQEASSE